MSPGPDGDSCGALTLCVASARIALADAPNCTLMSTLADEETHPRDAESLAIPLLDRTRWLIQNP